MRGFLGIAIFILIGYVIGAKFPGFYNQTIGTII